MNVHASLFGDLAPVSAFRPDDSRPLIIDSFAGGGGASTGIEMALGRSPDIAINHNAAALALHAANHPETLHLSENVWKVDPLDYFAGRHVGLMHFSPDCKHFSKAKGGKPVERNIRDLCWIIPGWIERLQKSGGRVDVVTMENVEEFKDYGPLIETDKGMMPDPARKGQTFQRWCKALRKLGGRIQFRELRACDYGAPTIRKRLFAVIRFDGGKIVWPAPTHGAPDDPDVIAGRKLPWRAAYEIIDWSLPCPSIFGTSAEILEAHGVRAVRPLAANTMARIARGMKRYVLDAERPFLVNLTHGGRCEDAGEPLRTITGAHRGEKAVVSPHLSAYYGPGDGGLDRSAPLDEPVRVVPCENRHALIAPHLMTMRNAGKPFNGADEPTHTITAGGAGLSLVAPMLAYAQQGGGNRPVDSPHHTICASVKDQNCVAAAYIAQANFDRVGFSPDEPVTTITGKGNGQLPVMAFIAQHNNDSRRHGGVNPGRAADAPLSTVTATGAQQGVVSAFISRQFDTGTGQGADEPAATVMANGGGKSMLAAPYLQSYYGTGDGQRHDEPGRTVTTKDRFGHVETLLGVPPFTKAQEARARQVADFLRAHGMWDEREFVTLTIGGATYVIVDIGLRMLTPRELYNAQGFPPDYVIDGAHVVPEGGGAARWVVFSKSVQVSCVGNSVSPQPFAALIAANCGHLAERRAA